MGILTKRMQKNWVFDPTISTSKLKSPFQKWTVMNDEYKSKQIWINEFLSAKKALIYWGALMFWWLAWVWIVAWIDLLRNRDKLNINIVKDIREWVKSFKDILKKGFDHWSNFSKFITEETKKQFEKIGWSVAVQRMQAVTQKTLDDVGLVLSKYKEQTEAYSKNLLEKSNLPHFEIEKILTNKKKLNSFMIDEYAKKMEEFINKLNKLQLQLKENNWIMPNVIRIYNGKETTNPWTMYFNIKELEGKIMDVGVASYKWDPFGKTLEWALQNEYSTSSIIGALKESNSMFKNDWYTLAMLVKAHEYLDMYIKTINILINDLNKWNYKIETWEDKELWAKIALFKAQ